MKNTNHTKGDAIYILGYLNAYNCLSRYEIWYAFYEGIPMKPETVYLIQTMAYA